MSVIPASLKTEGSPSQARPGKVMKSLAMSSIPGAIKREREGERDSKP
jgi:hypothetical protein